MFTLKVQHFTCFSSLSGHRSGIAYFQTASYFPAVPLQPALDPSKLIQTQQNFVLHITIILSLQEETSKANNCRNE